MRVHGSLVVVMALSLSIQSTSDLNHPSLAQSAARWLDALNNNNAKAATAYYSEDAITFAPYSHTTVGRTGILSNWESSFADRNSSHPMTIDSVVADTAGELGYVTGGWKAIWVDDAGHHEMNGKYLAVWRRQRNQRWEIVALSGAAFL